MNGKALILAAHGSDSDWTVNEAICELASRLRADLPFDSVVAAFHRGTPTFADALAQSGASDVVIVPLMTSAGHFATTVLPRQISQAEKMAGRTVRMTDPVGIHPLMVDLVASRVTALAAANLLNSEEATLLVIGHGTRRNIASREATVNLATELRRRRTCGQLIFAFLDDEPTLAGVLRRADHRTVIAIPFMIASGPHSCRDIPVAMGLRAMQPESLPQTQQVGDKTVVYDRPIGGDPSIARIVSELAQSRGADSSSTQVGETLFRLRRCEAVVR